MEVRTWAWEPLPHPTTSFQGGCGSLLLQNSSSKILPHQHCLKKKCLKKNDESDSKDHQTDLITTRILNNKTCSSFAFLSLPFWSVSWYK